MTSRGSSPASSAQRVIASFLKQRNCFIRTICPIMERGKIDVAAHLVGLRMVRIELFAGHRQVCEGLFIAKLSSRPSTPLSALHHAAKNGAPKESKVSAQRCCKASASS